MEAPRLIFVNEQSGGGISVAASSVAGTRLSVSSRGSLFPQQRLRVLRVSSPETVLEAPGDVPKVAGGGGWGGHFITAI